MSASALFPVRSAATVALPGEVTAGEGLLHAEVFSAQQLARHARDLATWHAVDRGRGGNPLLSRLVENEEVLRAVFDRLRSAGRVVPAGEWLLDNHYLILDQIATVRRHLPRRYSRELPRLAVGDLANMPRVYALALELISHADGRVDEDSLHCFISAYQESASLTLGELWAVPIMLRLALIENLRRIAVRVDVIQRHQTEAARWSERLGRIAEESPSALVVAIAELAREESPSAGFVAELHRRLQGQNPAVALVLQWLDQRLAEQHQNVQELIRADNQAQATDQLAVENAITSLRRMGGIDWRSFVEGLSPLEATLRRDPAQVYQTMDFATRDRYRQVIESLARRCRPDGPETEAAVAERVVALAAPDGHVGAWLLGARRPELEADLARTFGLRHPTSRGLAPAPLWWYAGPVVLLTLCLVALAAWVAYAGAGREASILIALLAALPASQLAVGICNWAATRLVEPRRLPRLDLSTGIPAELRTVVAVPTMLRRTEDAASLAEGLLVRHLANRESELVFVLLTDFADAPAEHQPDDEALLAHAAAAVAELNVHHGGRFVLLHRPRVYDRTQGMWMGRERKRGKIEDLNRLVLTGDATAFSRIEGDTAWLSGARYCIVLDTDTRLPRDAARELVATMAHPLNRPVLDAASRCVIAGHAILQPRAAIALGSSRRSWFANLWSGDAGIDPYTRTVSDLYQDMFDNGSFIGKGIYDIAVFETALRGRFPADAILSHDLIEGSYTRSALATDILVIEEHPERYLGDVARRGRWIRGDWQLLPWLWPTAPVAVGRESNPLSALAVWKIADNLRRSLVTGTAVALLFAAWAVLPGVPAAVITAGVVAVWITPTVLGGLGALRPGGETSLAAHFATVGVATGRGLTGAACELAFLPFEAARAVDAIIRTLWRLLVSRRHLLEWQTSSEAERQASSRLIDIARAMAVAPLAGLGALAIAVLRPEVAVAAVPAALAWIAAPVIAWILSLPRRREEAVAAAGDRDWMRCHARRTWRYFAELVGPDDRYLPPDNIQELPVRAIARRTSPTNIGIALLSDLAAHDLGFLTTRALLDRLELTVRSAAGLERFRGHLLNWYDTATGKPLAPRYVSAVDSGNLAGHLLVLAAGLRELAGLPPVAAARRLAGCATTLACAGTPEALRLAAEATDLRALATAAAALAAGSEHDAAEWCLLAVAEATAHADELEELGEAAAVEAVRVRAQALAAEAEAFALGMEWEFLLDPRSRLFAIGYQVDEARIDRSSYDLLASESRLGSFIAIAAGGIVQEHWFRLGRQQVRTAGGQSLVSWSGTMFEYLMPALVMPEEPGTLLHDAARAAVAEQIRYGRARGVPWGVSESAYHATDAALNWQYRAFGVPSLGLKRGLGDDLVVAPYAAALALLVEPVAAAAELRRYEEIGATGRYGFCEAIDYTPSRLPAGKHHAIIRSWMVHHQGMSLLAFVHVLENAPMRRRFLADPRLQAHRLLLQERPAGTIAAVAEPASDVPEGRAINEPSLRILTDPHPVLPEVHLLSNGRYHVLVTAAGTGGSRWDGLALTRWRRDPTADSSGPCLWLRDVEDGRTWSSTHYPAAVEPDSYEAIFTQARAEFRRSDHGILAHTEIAVSPEDDVELRRVHLTNRGDTERRIELTTYIEPVLAPPTADLAHPAFSNLFVETEALPEADAVLASRRPRKAGERRPWLAHALVVRGEGGGALSWETDRARFVGRGRNPTWPQAMVGKSGPLAGNVGAVLDPVLALRRTVIIPAGGRVTVDAVYAAANSRERAVELSYRYRDAHLADRVFGLSWTHGQVVLAQIGAGEAEAQTYARLAGALVFPTTQRRASSAEILRNRRTRSGLWSHGISGDLPICLLRVTDGQRLDLVRQLVRAHAWWASRGLEVDLVILVEDASSYRQELTDRILGLVTGSPSAGRVDRPGGIFVRRSDVVPEEDRHLLVAVALLSLTDAGGSLAQYADRRMRPAAVAALLAPPRPGRVEPPLPPPAYELLAANGLGGFTRDGREYIIQLLPGRTTPLPWCNVLANPGFGTVISERGSAYTWAGNCHEFRLTPWRCDPVADPHGEVVYIRDEDTGSVWCPTPGPLPGRSTRTVRHGFGYSVFAAGEQAIASELHTWVDAAEPVKILRLHLVNRSARQRRLTATLYLEWVLGELRERTAANVVTEHEEGVLFARNPLDDESPAVTAFAVASRRASSWTCDRAEFLGRGGSLPDPAAMRATRLLGRSGAGIDPCAALQVAIELDPGEEVDLSFAIGCGNDRDHARRLAAVHRGPEAVRASLDRVYDYWKKVLGTVRVRTADPELDVLINGWLVYQVISSRIFARSGFCQSGGAWGFRDQLQDAMALVHHAPNLLREQIVRAAGRQFRDGDVQHWWHPPRGRGVRTHISDDYLWLPYALCRYLDATGDRSVLEVRLPFLDGPQVPAEQESLYDLPITSDEQGTIYEHAMRAVLRGLRFGAHGLPLMGCGDWNDGMDRVGHAGRGESVWLGFFLADVLRRFAPLAGAAGDEALATRLTEEADALGKRIDAAAWDGEWYLRAWFDDGAPLGADGAAECRIDALPQAWAALTGACRPERARQAMAAVDRLLVRREEGLVQLFDPPFDRGGTEPGYIKGYVPGVRENGGQYTHAAVWTAMAWAKLGESGRALEIARLISPVRHGRDPQRWKAEPYVMAADVYRSAGNMGRAGWTWYTGSAGWMLRLLLESVLGVERHGDRLRIAAVAPEAIGDYEVEYRVGASRWLIAVRGAGGLSEVRVDGQVQADGQVPLVDDGREHRAEIIRRP